MVQPAQVPRSPACQPNQPAPSPGARAWGRKGSSSSPDAPPPPCRRSGGRGRAGSPARPCAPPAPAPARQRQPRHSSRLMWACPAQLLNTPASLRRTCLRAASSALLPAASCHQRCCAGAHTHLDHHSRHRLVHAEVGPRPAANTAQQQRVCAPPTAQPGPRHCVSSGCTVSGRSTVPAARSPARTSWHTAR